MKAKYLFVLIFSSLTFPLFADSKFEGKWTAVCRADASQYSQETVVYSGNSATLTLLGANDPKCKNVWLKATMTTTLNVGAGFSQGDIEVHPVDFIFSKVLFSFYDSAVIAHLNNSQYCGYSDWALGAEKDVTGRTCDGKPMPKSGEGVYDIAAVHGDKLYGGKRDFEFNGTSPEKRPAELDRSRPFVKRGM